MDGDTGAERWIEWARRKAEAAAGIPPPEASPAGKAAPLASFTGDQAVKARALIAAGAVTPGSDPGTWRVTSSDGRRDYVVAADGRCPCPAGMHGRPCKHSLAVRLAAAGAAQETAPLEGIVLDHAAARKLARDAAWRASPDAIMERAINSRR